MKTKEAALRAWGKYYGKFRPAGMVYQFPKGHWAYCSATSPVGVSLRESGMIYPELNIKAQQWEEVPAA